MDNFRKDVEKKKVKNKEDKNVSHIIKLAEERNSKVLEYDCGEYNCISIIKE